MRVLLLHPDDWSHPGPWAAQPWDLVVYLGRSPFVPQEPAFRCPMIHLDSYGQGLADARLVRDFLRAGRGHLIDREGIDWWELTSVAIVQQVFAVLQLQRVAAEMHPSSELWCTRPDWSAAVLASLLRVPVRNFRADRWTRTAARAQHYAQVLRRFSPAQIRQIFFDKYDAGYRWRSRFSAKPERCSSPVVLIPSAYANVSRMAASYAALIPDQRFLLVATRRSGHEFSPTANIEVRDLASYAQGEPQASELASVMQDWAKLKSHLHSSKALRLLSETGALDQFSGFFQWGLFVRDAWLQVLEREPVCGVLCGDDSNFYTRLPVWLAAKRNLPTVDFHHGALDGFYLFKDLSCDLYLAKSEMERDYLLRVCELPADKVVLAPPSNMQRVSSSQGAREGRSIVLFSEPYEIGGMRAEDVYRELLPNLWLLARRSERRLVIKLHPFESRVQRRRILQGLLPAEAARHVEWIEGPLTPELLHRTWFGITIESTTAIDCTQNDVCCFLCRWLTLSPFGYAEQYARYGMAESLQSAEQISEIPDRLSQFHNRRSAANDSATPDPAQLRQWLTSSRQESLQARSAS
jgi:hypothetical protein